MYGSGLVEHLGPDGPKVGGRCSPRWHEDDEHGAVEHLDVPTGHRAGIPVRSKHGNGSRSRGGRRASLLSLPSADAYER